MAKLLNRPLPQPPDGLQPFLYSFLRDLVNGLSAFIREVVNFQNSGQLSLLQLDILENEPPTPFNGMVVYADGTSWNPGAGVGFYGYQNGAWVKL